MDSDQESGVTPFRWWRLRGLEWPIDLAKLPPPEWDGWEVRYDNDVERKKRTTRHLDAMPLPLSSAVVRLMRPYYATLFSALLGYPVEVDPTLHGGGLHVTDPGGFLGTHLDYAVHPHLPGKERRLNLIAFLNPEWRPEWGGALQFCDAMGKVVREFLPEPGTVVAFETGDESYHGVSPVLFSADGSIPPRVTAAAYYITPLRPGVTRKRALFMPFRPSPAGAAHAM